MGSALRVLHRISLSERTGTVTVIFLHFCFYMSRNPWKLARAQILSFCLSVSFSFSLCSLSTCFSVSQEVRILKCNRASVENEQNQARCKQTLNKTKQNKKPTHTHTKKTKKQKTNQKKQQQKTQQTKKKQTNKLTNPGLP